MRIHLATALVLGTTAAAAAADVVVPEPPIIEPAVVPFSWTGAHVSAFASYGTGDFTVTGLPNLVQGGSGFDEGDVGGTRTVEPDGFGGGLSAGYDREFTVGGLGIVAGAEVEVGYLNLDEKFIVYADQQAPGVFDDNIIDVELGLYGAATARVGLSFDRFLAYVEGGGIAADVEANYGDLDGPLEAPFFDGGDLSGFEETRYGYVVGGGFEYAFRDNLSGRAEYNYVDLGSLNTTNADADTFETDLDFHVVKVGLSLRF